MIDLDFESQSADFDDSDTDSAFSADVQRTAEAVQCKQDPLMPEASASESTSSASAEKTIEMAEKDKQTKSICENPEGTCNDSVTRDFKAVHELDVGVYIPTGAHVPDDITSASSDTAR